MRNRTRPKIFITVVLSFGAASLLMLLNIIRLRISEFQRQNEELEPALKQNNAAQYQQESIGEIMIRTGTDKYWTHHYEMNYGSWFAPLRHKNGLKFLEIGADKGKSLALWAEYFEDPSLILGLAFGQGAKGVDATVKTEGFAYKNQDSLLIMWGDQSRKETMDAVCGRGPWDIIIDDGSHVPSHVVFSFVHLFPCLVPGGLYIIEDVETNYWDVDPSGYGYVWPGVGIGTSPHYSAIEKFKQLIDVLNRYELCHEELSVLPGDEDICSMTFSQNLIKFERCSEKWKKVRSAACLDWKLKRSNSSRIASWMQTAKSTNIDF